MKYFDVEANEEMIRSFKEFAPQSPGAILLERMVILIEERAKLVLFHPGATEQEMRVAQGKIIAMQELSALANEFVNVDLEKWGKPENVDEEVDGDNLMEAKDVGC